MAGCCVVLLSTYNGEAYLGELLDSLAAQSYPEVKVIVRDDGSTDQTAEVLQNAKNNGQLEVELGNNLGVPEAFWELLARTPADAGYVAFCDQDDVWKPDKLEKAIAALEHEVDEGRPGLYCSSYEIVDRNLFPTGERPPSGLRASFENALVENIVTGCTAVINRPAIDLLISHRPRTPRMHDWWTYLVVSALGIVIADDYRSMLYRQHGGNTVGLSGGRLRHYLKRLQRFRSADAGRVRTLQAEEFREVYGHLLDGARRAVLDEFLDGRRTLRGRVRYAAKCPVVRQSRADDVLLRALILLNRV